MGSAGLAGKTIIVTGGATGIGAAIATSAALAGAQVIVDYVVSPEQAFAFASTLGSLKNRAADILAYFDRPGTSNGPTEAIIDYVYVFQARYEAFKARRGQTSAKEPDGPH
jgi:NAD(P)-dependent dehydrogenase (short-subunit alcohol dehydrogenase family)